MTHQSLDEITVKKNYKKAFTGFLLSLKKADAAAQNHESAALVEALTYVGSTILCQKPVDIEVDSVQDVQLYTAALVSAKSTLDKAIKTLNT